MNATSNENSHPVNRALADEELDAVSGGTFLQPLFDRIHETQVSKAVDYVIGATITSLVKLVS